MIEPRLEVLAEKKLIGKRLRMSLSNDRTPELWKSFMPSRKKIENLLSTDLFSLQIYDSSLDFKDFNPDTEFEKWAAAEVSEYNEIPEGMSPHILKGGLYAVFIYKGAANSFQKTFRYIFNSWLPESEYELDNREHFEILGEKYKNNEPDSEEEVWIPVKQKK